MPMVPGTVTVTVLFSPGARRTRVVSPSGYCDPVDVVQDLHVLRREVQPGSRGHVSELGRRSVEPSPPEGALPRLLRGGNGHLLEAVGEWRRACRSRRLAAGEEPSAPAPPADLGRREPLQPRSTPNANGRGRSGQARRSHASTTSEAICLQRLFELVVRSTRLLRASTDLASSAAGLAASATLPPCCGVLRSGQSDDAGCCDWGGVAASRRQPLGFVSLSSSSKSISQSTPLPSLATTR